jgi:hypothetical protein
MVPVRPTAETSGKNVRLFGNTLRNKAAAKRPLEQKAWR